MTSQFGVGILSGGKERDLTMAERKGDPRHEQQQGPASLQQEGPAAGHTLKDLGQPVQTTNDYKPFAQETDKQA